MLAILLWQCDCGAHVKAMYNTYGKTTVRCSNPSCGTTHIVDGTITELWVEDASHLWKEHDLAPLVVH